MDGKIDVGTLCVTCGSSLPPNNGLLVVVTEVDLSLAPDIYRVRQVTGIPFYATTLPNGLRKWQSASEAWTRRSRLRPVDPDGELERERQRDEAPA